MALYEVMITWTGFSRSVCSLSMTDWFFSLSSAIATLMLATLFSISLQNVKLYITSQSTQPIVQFLFSFYMAIVNKFKKYKY